MEIQATVTTGTSAVLLYDFQQLPMLSPTAGASTGKARAPISGSRKAGAKPITRKLAPQQIMPQQLAPEQPSSGRMPNRTWFVVDLPPCQDDDTSHSECVSDPATSSSTDPPSH